VVESSGLLNRRRVISFYRGFESPPLRQIPNSIRSPPNPLETLLFAWFDSRNTSKGSESDVRNSPPFQLASCTTKRRSFLCSAAGCARNRSAALLVSAI
jgi:hypothetical protein